MTIARGSINRGPGIVKLGGDAFYSDGDIIETPNPTFFDIVPSMYGPVDRRRDDFVTNIAFTPIGEWEKLTRLYPAIFSTPDIGADIFTSSDVPLVIHSKAGKTHTFPAGAMTKLPDIILSARRTLFGACEMTALVADNTDPTSANSRVTDATSAFGDTSFSTAAVKTQPYAAAWGASAPWDAIITESGWRVSFDVKLQPQQIDDIGTIAMVLESVRVMAKCTPVGITEAQVHTALKFQGVAEAARGSSLRTNSADLVISASGVSVTLKNAQLVEGPLRWGTFTLRTGEIAFVGERTESSGAFGALFVLA